MQSILEQITDWLKSMIISGIMGNLSGMFDSVNQQVGQIAGDVGTTPANFSPAVFSMIRNISESVILPIAGMVLTFIACYELIQMLIEHNNLANFETWTFFKWVFKTFLAVTLISNTFNITMAVFDVAQQVISRSGGLISGSTSVSDATLTAMQATLEGMDLGPLLGLYLPGARHQLPSEQICEGRGDNRCLVLVRVHRHRQLPDLHRVRISINKSTHRNEHRGSTVLFSCLEGGQNE